MHRTICPTRSLLAALLLALLAGSWPAAGRAQEARPAGRLIVPLNGTIRLQMTTRRPIRTVTTPKENVVNIRPVPGDPTTVLIVGQQPDVTRIEMVDVNGRRETFDVIVQPDIEYLRTQVRRAVPTANIDAIPTANNAIVLTGTLTQAEDVPIVMGIAQSLGFQAVNGMRVGGVQQVQLDVVVAEVDRNKFRSIAFNFLTDSPNFFLGSTVGQAVTEPASVGRGGVFSVAGTLVGSPGSPGGNPSNLLFGVLHNTYGFLGFLNALKTESVGKVMAEPRLVTLSGQPASFLSGGEQAVPVPAGLGQIGVQFEEFGVRLNFLPVVLGDGRIHLEVEPEVSSLNPSFGTSLNGVVVPGRDTDRVHTTVELESGQTFLIGGLIQHTVSANAQKVPILGEIPFLSPFFSSQNITETEEELIILVTPYLVDALSCAQRPRILPGQETRSPDDFELFLESIIEAPRGQREICHGHRYVPAYKNSPSTAVFPCPGNGTGGCCGAEGCGAGFNVDLGHAPAGLNQPAPPLTPAAVPVGQPLPPAELGGSRVPGSAPPGTLGSEVSRANDRGKP
jgi:pilus assembly protein CpaC